MTTAVHSPPTVQRTFLMAALAVTAGLAIQTSTESARLPFLFLLGIGLGVALYHAAFGFTSAYRRAIVDRDISGITAQLIMLAVAMILFAPVLAAGSAFGNGVVGAVAPVSVSMAFGAFIFGVGMQLGGGCGSGTLYTAGGGSLRMILVLVFFCIGGFWGSLDLGWWSGLPGIGAISIGNQLGWAPAIAMQLAALGAIYWLVRRIGENRQPLWWQSGFSIETLLHGPWPFLFSALLLALFNWLTLLIAGHPWSITWAFALWAAKAAVALGWDPASSGFWSGGFPGRSLAQSVFADTTSVMNFGIVIGAFTAASLAGRMKPKLRIPVRSLAAAVIGGLLLGYGARLAYGCNIGAFFSGVASTSLHGWVWIIMAIPGNWLGVRLRPLFGL